MLIQEKLIIFYFKKESSKISNSVKFGGDLLRRTEITYNDIKHLDPEEIVEKEEIEQVDIFLSTKAI